MNEWIYISSMSRQKETIAKLLLEHGAQADMYNKDGRTPLHFAAYANLADVTKSLIQCGCAVNAQVNK